MQSIGYAGVSTAETADQNLALQLEALKAAGCNVLRSEKKTGTAIDGRTELAIVLDFIGEGDVLVVTKLDRLARSPICLPSSPRSPKSGHRYACSTRTSTLPRRAE